MHSIYLLAGGTQGFIVDTGDGRDLKADRVQTNTPWKKRLHERRDLEDRLKQAQLEAVLSDRGGAEFLNRQYEILHKVTTKQWLEEVQRLLQDLPTNLFLWTDRGIFVRIFDNVTTSPEAILRIVFAHASRNDPPLHRGYSYATPRTASTEELISYYKTEIKGPLCTDCPKEEEVEEIRKAVIAHWDEDHETEIMDYAKDPEADRR